MRFFRLLAALTVAACSSDDEPPPGLQDAPPPVEETTLCPVVAAGSDETVVLVRDTGFDLKNEVFQGRIGGCYRLRCRASAAPRPATFAQARQALLDELARKDDSCRLEPGVTLTRSSAFEGVEDRREAWNAAVRSGVAPDRSVISAVEPVVEGEGGYLYHGTGVAGLIAQDNPRARLVLISDETIQAPGAPVTCPSRADIDQQIALLEDPDVRAAYAASPTDALTDDLLLVMRNHGVAVANESFGALPSAALAELCPGNWRRFFELTAELEAARTAALAGAGVFAGVSVLTVRAAGNEGETIDAPADHLGCAGRTQPDAWGPGSETVMVGALTSDSWVPTSFSNTGVCVDAFAPGYQIITWAPRDFLTVQSGTSFSAPLLARLASTLPAADAAARRAALDARLDAGGKLPREQLPAGVLFSAPTPTPRLLPPHRSPQALLRPRAIR